MKHFFSSFAVVFLLLSGGGVSALSVEFCDRTFCRLGASLCFMCQFLHQETGEWCLTLALQKTIRPALSHNCKFGLLVEPY